MCLEVSTSKKRGITWRSRQAVIRFHILWACLPSAGEAAWQLAGLCGSLCHPAQDTGTAEPKEDCNAAVGNAVMFALQKPKRFSAPGTDAA